VPWYKHYDNLTRQHDSYSQRRDMRFSISRKAEHLLLIRNNRVSIAHFNCYCWGVSLDAVAFVSSSMKETSDDAAWDCSVLSNGGTAVEELLILRPFYQFILTKKGCHVHVCICCAVCCNWRSCNFVEEEWIHLTYSFYHSPTKFCWWWYSPFLLVFPQCGMTTVVKSGWEVVLSSAPVCIVSLWCI